MIDVTLHNIGFRFRCVACGGLIEKGEWHGAFERPKTSWRNSLCRDCMASNDLPGRLRLQASAVREEAAREAAWIESLADETWNIPTEAELAQAEADYEAYWGAEEEAAKSTEAETLPERMRLWGLDRLVMREP